MNRIKKKTNNKTRVDANALGSARGFSSSDKELLKNLEKFVTDRSRKR